jgi:complement component 1 Q subcomponent-binding protein, mitochondrial
MGLDRIKVKFSIADMNYEQDADQMDVENALDDEDLYDDVTPQRGGAQTKGTVNQGRTPDGNVNVAPEDSVAPADRPGLADNEDAAAGEQPQSPAFPATVHVTIAKPGKGAVQIVTNAQDGVIVIENVYYYPNAEIADAETPESDFARSNIYAGPPFQNLDPELQNMLERYLDERGINEQLATFVPDYVDHKEQREYVQWLESEFGSPRLGFAANFMASDMKGFVDA